MIPTIEFTIPIEPVAKARPRLGRGGHVFTPPKTKKFESQFVQLAKKFQPTLPRSGPIEVRLGFFVAKPKSTKRHYPTIKPDVDNLAKAVLDAMNGRFYEDDSQVVTLTLTKRYSIDPRIEVYIETIELYT